MPDALRDLTINFDTTSETSHEDAALKLAESGFCVFPLWGIDAEGRCRCGHCSDTSSRRGKHPILKGGYLKATVDSSLIRAWWTAYPDANIGLPTGLNDIFAIDIDPAGLEMWKRTVKKRPELSRTVYIRTGRGLQALFSQDSDVKLTGATNALGEGVDTRGEGNYIIAPPSKHYTGNTYQWEHADLPIAPLPSWLHSSLASRAATEQRDPKERHNAGYLEYDLEDAREILNQLGASWYNDRDRWVRVGMALKAKLTIYGGPGLAGAWELFDAWSAQGDSYNQKENWKQWTTLKEQSTLGRAVTFGSIIHESGLSLPESLPRSLQPSPSLSSELSIASLQLSSLSLRSVGSLLKNRKPIPEDLVPGLIPAESTVLFSGHGGVGKSYILLDLCIAAALNQEWMGRSVRSGLQPLYIDLENKDFRIAERIDAILRGREVPLDALDNAPITFSDYSPYALDSDELMWVIAEAAQACDANLIILDSLADLLGGLDENSNSDMARAASRLRSISSMTGATMIVQHHVSKGAAALGGDAPRAAARGASALFDDVEVSFQLIRMGETLSLVQDKNRVNQEIGIELSMLWWSDLDRNLSFKTEYLRDTLGHTSVKKVDVIEEALLENLIPYPEWTSTGELVQGVMDLLDKSRSTVYRRVTALLRDKVLEKSGTSHVRLRSGAA